MFKCPVCAASIPEGSTSSCPACGATLGASQLWTLISGEVFQARGGHAPHPADTSRFVPGALLAGRYRIVTLLGRGGMGEVYRADDLKLRQPVALKFLPESLTGSNRALTAFHREVSLARQVSHPNICRVFDIGEVEGQSFLTMEFIDGENLAVLLRRIGRLPTDKALELARQLCAGLAAIHDAGVLHRDLKPANVMIDGRGRARITDFGVAALTGEKSEGDSGAGTPAYMAPEQREGQEVTARTDLYSLGLVLYEMFTGRRAFPEGQESTRPTRPSKLVQDIDRKTEAIILRCLEREPAARPASTLEVVGALPGGNPLAAALAAGETPSPEMVAAAPKQGGLRPGVAAVCFCAVLLGLSVLLSLSEQVMASRPVSFKKSPEELAERARSVLKSLGHGTSPIDSAYGLLPHTAFNRYLLEKESTGLKGEIQFVSDRPPLFWFWYRQSPRLLIPEFLDVEPESPPRSTPGEAYIVLDPEGRLHQLEVVPGRNARNISPAPLEWSALLAEAGFDEKSLKPVRPSWTPPVFADNRAAWEGFYPGPMSPRIPIRIEAATFLGKPVSFEILHSKTRPADHIQKNESLGIQIYFSFGFFLFLGIIITASLLARRNLQAGRGDRRGAWRLAIFVFIAESVGWIFSAHHVPSYREFSLIASFSAIYLLTAAQIWIFYIGLEPPLRRHWPERIISWSRLLSGSFRDPLVGRDILIGCLFGLGNTLAYYAVRLITSHWRESSTFQNINLDALSDTPGLNWQFSQDRDVLVRAILMPLGMMVLLLLLRILLRYEAAAIGILWAFITVVIAAGEFNPLPLTFDLSAWYAKFSLFSTSAVLILAFYGFLTSIGSQRLFRSEILDD